tara:strand:- start:154 stop:468 length:315 start_codon:yes stop_codon:yes gene_type:complete
MSGSRLPSQEGYQQLLDVVISFKGEDNEKCVATVDICERMEKKYGHIYELSAMENYLLELTKQAGLKHSGKIKKETPEKFLKKETFMPIKPDKDGIYRTSVWDV